MPRSGAPPSAPKRRATRARPARGAVPGAGTRASRRYVYCIIRSPGPHAFGPLGMGAPPAEVTLVECRELAAVVSAVPPGPIEPTLDNVLAHQRVNETVMREHTVLPLAFGTVFKSEEDIAELLRSAYDAFEEVLEQMSGKRELGLKVLWNPEAAARALDEDDEGLRTLRRSLAEDERTGYFARVHYSQAREAALKARAESDAASILGTLARLAVAHRTNKLIGDRMILNAAFLLRRSQEDAFDAEVKALAARMPELTFKYTGPWPPYNFVSLRLRLEPQG